VARTTNDRVIAAHDLYYCLFRPLIQAGTYSTFCPPIQASFLRAMP